MTKPKVASPRQAANPGIFDPNTDLLLAGSKTTFIQWASEREIEGISEKLMRIQRSGIKLEAEGDYFKSGDLAYQIQEIIRATAELMKKCQRAEA